MKTRSPQRSPDLDLLKEQVRDALIGTKIATNVQAGDVISGP
jgi:hypothetical protein